MSHAQTRAMRAADLRPSGGQLRAGTVHRQRDGALEQIILAQFAGHNFHLFGAVQKHARQRGLDLDSLTAPAAHTSLATSHINAVWQVDASVCVLYRAPGFLSCLCGREPRSPACRA